MPLWSGTQHHSQILCGLHFYGRDEPESLTRLRVNSGVHLRDFGLLDSMRLLRLHFLLLATTPVRKSRNHSASQRFCLLYARNTPFPSRLEIVRPSTEGL